tara:strand:+ start:354 stop:593 length:240 start_codon:yes stop_codon:yes gene_type:complete
MQRREIPQAGDSIEISASRNQRLRKVGTSKLRRPVQSRHAITLGSVHVLTRTQESLHLKNVSTHSSIGDWCFRHLKTRE